MIQIKTILILFALTVVARQAIIGSTIYSLARLFKYRISLNFNDKTLVAYATLAPTTLNCPSGKCFLGWLGSYSLRGAAVEDFGENLGANSPLFFTQVLPTPTLTLISNTSLQSIQMALLDITARILTPISFLSSNVAAVAQPQPYFFVPLDSKAGQVMKAASIDPSALNYELIAQQMLSVSSWVGWSSSHPPIDVMLYDHALNCIFDRRTIIEGQTKVTIHVELLSKSIFADLTNNAQIIEEIQSVEGNSRTFDGSSVYPGDSIVTLLSLL